VSRGCSSYLPSCISPSDNGSTASRLSTASASADIHPMVASFYAPAFLLARLLWQLQAVIEHWPSRSFAGVLLYVLSGFLFATLFIYRRVAGGRPYYLLLTLTC
jgi:hypothetical protein